MLARVVRKMRGVLPCWILYQNDFNHDPRMSDNFQIAKLSHQLNNRTKRIHIGANCVEKSIKSELLIRYSPYSRICHTHLNIKNRISPKFCKALWPSGLRRQTQAKASQL